MTNSHAVEFFDDPRAFLEVAADHLAVDPVISSVVSMVAARWARRCDAGEQPEVEHPLWWAVVRDATGAVSGVAMGTAPFVPHPPYVLPMPEAAAHALAAGILDDLGLSPQAVNGALPAARTVAEDLAGASGGEVRVHEHMRLFEVTDLVWPTRPAGSLRLVRRDEAELALQWFRDFHAEADKQAGREPDPCVQESFGLDDVLERIDDAWVWVWGNDADRPVHLTAANVPAYGVNRIGPVYTPPDQRGHGFARRAVAEVSQLFLGQGLRACLFTDQANPVSNAVYQAIGYRAVVDMANFRVDRP